MTDLISRQAVIDAIYDSRAYFTNEFNRGFFIDKIRDIQSVEPKQEWISVEDRLPEELKPVNITWKNHKPEPYYSNIKDIPFVATGVYYRGQWYWYSTYCVDLLAEYGRSNDDIVDDAIEITAWCDLPEPYKGDKESK